MRTKIFHTSLPLKMVCFLNRNTLFVISYAFSKEFPTTILQQLATPSQYAYINYHTAETQVFAEVSASLTTSGALLGQVTPSYSFFYHQCQMS